MKELSWERYWWGKKEVKTWKSDLTQHEGHKCQRNSYYDFTRKIENQLGLSKLLVRCFSSAARHSKITKKISLFFFLWPVGCQLIFLFFLDAGFNSRPMGAVVVVHNFKNGLTFGHLDWLASHFEGSCRRVRYFRAYMGVMTWLAQPTYQPKIENHA